MRIDRLNLKNFKCFAEKSIEFRPGFNLIVGENGAGKTTILDALAVASGSWLLGLSKYSEYCKTKSIALEEARLESKRVSGSVIRYERHFPVAVEASGVVQAHHLQWMRTLEGVKGRTTSAGASDLKHLGEKVGEIVMRGDEVTLPLISYYGTGRLWQQPRDLKARRAKSSAKSKTSVFRGYINSHDPRSSAADLFRWIQNQQFIALEEGKKPVALEVLTKAILGCIEGGKKLYFSVKQADLILETEQHGRQPFNNLSDGFRNMVAVVGDIAFKAVTLNPHLGMKAAAKTPGVVLIDELDLHLHPKWQRRVIGDLKRTFPAIQFICTSHSPFLIQSLAPGELIPLNDKVSALDYSGLPIEDIAEDIQGVDEPQQSLKNKKMAEAAEKYFALLQKDKRPSPAELAEAEKDYREANKPYATEPGLQALLRLRALAAAEKYNK